MLKIWNFLFNLFKELVSNWSLGTYYYYYYYYSHAVGGDGCSLFFYFQKYTSRAENRGESKKGETQKTQKKLRKEVKIFFYFAL